MSIGSIGRKKWSKNKKPKIDPTTYKDQRKSKNLIEEKFPKIISKNIEINNSVSF